MDKFKVLKEYFGYTSFRNKQEEIIDYIIGGSNVLAVLPTGAGKSLCYQIPALLSPNISIVISPLISLMKDQVDALNRKGTIAAFINSSMEYYEIEGVLNLIYQNKLKLLYVAPERLESQAFLDRIKNINISFLFVDEAHCISEWGHSFRPSYRKISQFVNNLKIRKISGFTATATPEVIKDIVHQLNLRSPKIVISGFKRENIAVSVFPVKNKKEKTLELISHYGTPAIVYTSSRKKSEELYEFLSLRKIKSSFYHAGLSALERKVIQENFIESRVDVIIATNAFGMGIDKPNIRLVVHFNMPGSIENYYQEIGRAGRDGEPSAAVLLFDNSDVAIQRFLIDNNYPSKDIVLNVYNAICDFGMVAVGSISEKTIPINIDYICHYIRKDISQSMLDSSLRLLEDSGFIRQVNSADKQTSFIFAVTPQSVKKIISKNVNSAGSISSPTSKSDFLLFLIRKFGANAFNRRVSFLLSALAKEVESNEQDLDALFSSFADSGIIEYDRPLLQSGVMISLPRIDTNRFPFDFSKLNNSYLLAKKKLDLIIDFVYSKNCRFSYILDYFGDPDSDYKCGKCDNCSSQNLSSSTIDEFINENILLTLYLSDNGLRENDLINILTGRTKSSSLKLYKTFGSCYHYSKFDLSKIVQRLTVAGYIKKNIYLKNKFQLTNKGKDYLTQGGLIQTDMEDVDYEKNMELLFKLKNIRKSVANQIGQSEKIVCSDEILAEIILKKPLTKVDLLCISGFNERMFNKIGERFITTINEFSTEDKNLSLVFDNESGENIPANLSDTLEYIKRGFSLSQIAKQRNLSEEIISMHIETILESVPNINTEKILTKDKFTLVLDSVNNGIYDPRLIKQKFPIISYPEIRVALAIIIEIKKGGRE